MTRLFELKQVRLYMLPGLNATMTQLYNNQLWIEDLQ